ncbi:hypothetical protein ABZZ74_22605 [Streptomyces sp. NPDC006476]
MDALTARLLAVGLFDQFIKDDARNLKQFRFGREPYGSAALPWSWDDLE